MSQERFFKKRTVIFLHVIAWLLFFSIPMLIHSPVVFSHNDFTGGHGVREFVHAGPPIFEWTLIITDLLLVGIFYLNAYILLSGFIIKKKILRSLGIQFLLFLGFCLVSSLLMKWAIGNNELFSTPIKGNIPDLGNPSHMMRPKPFQRHRFHIVSLFPFLFKNSFSYFFILTASIAYRMTIDRIRASRLVKEKENENLKTELLLLRSQISPHFMFNVLNNMVSLARKGSDKLENSLIKLSGIMRYLYYDTKEDKISLIKELDYLKSYIDLQELRFHGVVKVESDIQLTQSDDSIEPMLLIPFIENAFKHGIVLIPDPEINISLSVEDHILHFKVKNKFSPDSNEIKDKTPGIGLNNVRRRLELSYGDDYILNIKKSEQWYTVLLHLNLI